MIASQGQTECLALFFCWRKYVICLIDNMNQISYRLCIGPVMSEYEETIGTGKRRSDRSGPEGEVWYLKRCSAPKSAF